MVIDRHATGYGRTIITKLASIDWNEDSDSILLSPYLNRLMTFSLIHFHQCRWLQEWRVVQHRHHVAAAPQRKTIRSMLDFPLVRHSQSYRHIPRCTRKEKKFWFVASSLRLIIAMESRSALERLSPYAYSSHIELFHMLFEMFIISCFNLTVDIVIAYRYCITVVVNACITFGAGRPIWTN